MLGMLLLQPLPIAIAHPLHTTITDLTLDARTRKVQAVIRIFADDFEAAVAGPRKGTTDDRSKAAYVARQFVVRGADGKPIALRWRGSKLTDDLLWIQLEGEAPRGLRGATVMNAMASELFGDQVNIVKARYGTQQRTLLFTRGARPKRLP